MLPSATAWPDGTFVVSWTPIVNRRRNYNWSVIVAVADTSAIWATMVISAATASDWNDQAILSVNAVKRHGLCGKRKADSSGNRSR